MVKYFIASIVFIVFYSCDKTKYISHISTNFPVEASEPNLHLSNSGNIYLSYISSNPDKKESSLLFSMFDNLNYSWNKPNLIVESDKMFVNWADFPEVTTDNLNGITAHYLEMSSEKKYSYDIKIVNSTDQGFNWSNPIKLHSDNTKTEHGFVSTVNIKNGFLSTYLDGRQNELSNHDKSIRPQMTLRGTSYNIDGNILEDLLIDDRVCDCCQTDLAITENGQSIVVYRDRSEDEVRDIYYSYKKDSKWSKPINIFNDNWKISGCPVNGPAISTYKNNSAVVWYTFSKNKNQIKVVFTDNISSGFQRPILVEANDPIGRVDIELLDPNNAIISFIDIIDDKAYIKLQMITKGGSQSKLLLIDESSENRSSGFPVITLNKEKSNTIIAWTESKENFKIKTAVVDNSFFFN
ncbi:MAG: hypothetical protein VX573_03450 [Bacteroidota bacterium]|nr:hypothetical protein [Bacteroidota bacterium]|tara:strand:+ start:324 stop:1550 length:1227 start_codon:yes stop_codon:yes gene_type:complete